MLLSLTGCPFAVLNADSLPSQPRGAEVVKAGTETTPQQPPREAKPSALLPRAAQPRRGAALAQPRGAPRSPRLLR